MSSDQTGRPERADRPSILGPAAGFGVTFRAMFKKRLTE